MRGAEEGGVKARDEDEILRALELAAALVVVGHARRGCERTIKTCDCEYARRRKTLLYLIGLCKAGKLVVRNDERGVK